MSDSQRVHSYQVDWPRLADAISQAMQRGLPLPDVLTALAEELPDRATKAAFHELAERTRRGESLQDALEAVSEKGSRELRGLLAAASATSQPGESFLELLRGRQNYLDRLLDLRSALSYPLVCGAVTTVGLGLLAWNWWHLWQHRDWVPSLRELTSFEPSSPPATEVLFATAWWPLASVLAGVLAVLGFLLLLRVVLDPTGLAQRGWIYRVPILGRYYKAVALVQFCELMRHLVASSVRLPEAVRLTADLTDWPQLRRALLAIVPQIESGKPLSEALAQFRWFPSLAFIYLADSEQSAPLEDRLRDCGELFDNSARWLGSRLETIFTLFIAGGLYPFVQFAFTCGMWITQARLFY